MKLEILQKAIFQEAPKCVGEHMILVFVAMFISICIAIPLGIWVTRKKWDFLAPPVMTMLNIFMTIPALAFVAAAMPLLGIGFKPAITILVIQSLLPIAKNTVVGLLEVPSDVKEAAKGMGMNGRQILLGVELPLALPVILGGVRTAVIYVVSTATLAGFIGAGGLGLLISKGLNLFIREYIVVGATLGALIAIILDRIIGIIERKRVLMIYHKN